MSRFWLFLGIFLVCSGIGTAFGIILLVLYFWNDLKQSIQGCNQTQEYQQHNPNDPQYYDDDTIERMK